eukprot:UN05600
MTNTPIQPTADGQFQDLLPKTTTQNNTNGQQIQKVNQFLTRKIIRFITNNFINCINTILIISINTTTT